MKIIIGLLLLILILTTTQNNDNNAVHTGTTQQPLNVDSTNHQNINDATHAGNAVPKNQNQASQPPPIVTNTANQHPSATPAIATQHPTDKVLTHPLETIITQHSPQKAGKQHLSEAVAVQHQASIPIHTETVAQPVHPTAQQSGTNINPPNKDDTVNIETIEKFPNIPVQQTQEQKIIDQVQKHIENEQVQAQMQFEKEQQQQLHQWIVQQMTTTQQTSQFRITQQVSIPIQSGSSAKFKWNPQKNKKLKMQVMILQVNQQGDLSQPQNPPFESFVEIQTKRQTQNIFHNLGKVYLNRIFQIDFDTDYRIFEMINNYDRNLVVTIDFEGMDYILDKGVQDDKLEISRQKIYSVLEEMKQTEIKRQNRYKWEWGFKDKQQRHQQQMLALTGVELFVIIVTAIVQMYCIKNLLDNRTIV